MLFKVQMICKGPESKIVRALEKFGKGFSFPYTVGADKDRLKLEFCVRNLAARTEILRRLRHVKGFELTTIRTDKAVGK